MRLLSFEHGYGAEQGGEVIDLSARIGAEFPTLLSLIAGGGLARAQAALGEPGPRHRLGALKRLKPFADGGAPPRIFCVGLNYPKRHPLGGEVAAPAHPSLFAKVHDALVADGEALEPPAISAQHDYEAELTLVIGKPGRAIPRAAALSHIAGYTCMNEGSVRDFQAHSVWAGKNFHRSGALGPWIVTADEIPDPAALRLCSRLNGAEVQNACVGEMFFDVPAIVSYVSSVLPLRPGDMIATGSPSGTGATQTPPRFLRPGDRIEVEIERIGVLANTVGSPA